MKESEVRLLFCAKRASNHGSTRQEMVPEATEFRFSVGVTRMDRIKNEYIRQRREVTLFGHVSRRDTGYTERMMLKMELPGKRKRGRSKIKFMEFQKEVQKMKGR